MVQVSIIMIVVVARYTHTNFLSMMDMCLICFVHYGNYNWCCNCIPYIGNLAYPRYKFVAATQNETYCATKKIYLSGVKEKLTVLS